MEPSLKEDDIQPRLNQYHPAILSQGTHRDTENVQTAQN